MVEKHVVEEWSRGVVLQALDCNTTESHVACGAWQTMSVCKEESLPCIMTSLPFPSFNEYMKPRLVEDNATAYVQTSVHLAKRSGVPITWSLGALPTPENLGKILVENGFMNVASPWGMAVQLLHAEIEPALKLKIVEVTHAGQLDEFSAVMCPAHEMPVNMRGPWTEMFKAVGYGDGSAWRHFIGYLGEEAVGTSSSYVGAGVVSVTHVTVAPDYRGWGFGSEMAAWPLGLARDMGYRIGTLWSTDAGKDMCERLGFTALCRGQTYLWSPD